jgi:hypothetical protein
MHFLCSHEGSINLGYRHRHPIHPIIQHVFIPNINRVIPKFIDGEEKTKLLMFKELTSGTLARRVAQLGRVCNIKNRFQLKLKIRKIQIELNGSK